MMILCACRWQNWGHVPCHADLKGSGGDHLVSAGRWDCTCPTPHGGGRGRWDYIGAPGTAHSAQIENAVVLMGSHDPMLDLLGQFLLLEHGIRLTSSNVGSLGRVDRVATQPRTRGRNASA
ncbi:MAG UNVERIFIED_CONTAM: hypothetical protein LVT10_22725 [Anaerolineae bacterium]